MYQRIVDALAADIANGRLLRGQRLPTHRALADALEIDLTTVTRAYGEARRRGLVEAHVGRGHLFQRRRRARRTSCRCRSALISR
jgi:DNA-binding transcriptional MocR family regulator